MQWENRWWRGISEEFTCDAIQNNLSNISKTRLLGDGVTVLSYVIIRDDAFPLKENLIKSYSFRARCYEKRTFNYRPGRARRIVENGFEILTNRFRVFLSPIQLGSKLLRKLLLQAACCTIIYGSKYRCNIHDLELLTVRISKTEAFRLGNDTTTSRVYNQFM